MGKVMNTLANLFAVLVVSVIIFFLIYFLSPELSFKCFGVAWNERKLVENVKISIRDSINNSENLTDSEKRGRIADLESTVGTYLTKLYLENIRKGSGKEILAIFESEDGKSVIESARKYVNEGAGSAEEYFQTEEGKMALDSLKKEL